MTIKTIAGQLVSALSAKDESKLRGLISPNIAFALTTNDRNKISKQGVDEYLTVIREIWEKTLESRFASYLYTEYTPNSAEIRFEQIYLVKGNGQNVVLLKKGTQIINLDNQKIIDICVTEKVSCVWESDYNTIVARINRQKSKIEVPQASNFLRDCGCSIL